MIDSLRKDIKRIGGLNMMMIEVISKIMDKEVVIIEIIETEIEARTDRIGSIRIEEAIKRMNIKENLIMIGKGIHINRITKEVITGSKDMMIEEIMTTEDKEIIIGIMITEAIIMTEGIKMIDERINVEIMMIDEGKIVMIIMNLIEITEEVLDIEKITMKVRNLGSNLEVDINMGMVVEDKEMVMEEQENMVKGFRKVVEEEKEMVIEGPENRAKGFRKVQEEE